MSRFRHLFPAFLVGALPSTLLAQGPVLETPGSATWDTVPTDTGFQTIFTISEDTVFSWGNLNLPRGSQLIFDFIGGESVVNQLGGTAPHIIAGDVSGNGSIGFFSPNADILLTGNITANEVTLATMGVDAADFADGGGFEMFGSGTSKLAISGEVRADSGDVVLAGPRVDIHEVAEVTASDSIFVGGGSAVILRGEKDRQLTVSGEAGGIRHAGTSLADRIEMKAVSALENLGTIGEGGARVFLEVGDSGRITAESRGLIADAAVFQGLLDRGGVRLDANEGDVAAAVSDAKLKLPDLKRPDGSRVSAARAVTTSAPMSASADAGRQRAKRSERTTKQESNRQALVRRRLFFGTMRGGRRDQQRDQQR